SVHLQKLGTDDRNDPPLLDEVEEIVPRVLVERGGRLMREGGAHRARVSPIREPRSNDVRPRLPQIARLAPALQAWNLRLGSGAVQKRDRVPRAADRCMSGRARSAASTGRCQSPRRFQM